MNTTKVSLSSDFGTLADIWAPLTSDDLDWFRTTVIEDHAGSFSLERGEVSIYVPDESSLDSLRAMFNQLAVG